MDAMVLFYNNADAQVFSHELSSIEIATLTAATTRTVTIQGIPASAEKIAIIANDKTYRQETTYSGISKSASIDVANRHSSLGASKVINRYCKSMFGQSPSEIRKQNHPAQ